MAKTDSIEYIANKMARDVHDGKPSGFLVLPTDIKQKIIDYMKTDSFKAQNPDYAHIISVILDERISQTERILKSSLTPPAPPKWDGKLKEILRNGREASSPDDTPDTPHTKKSAFQRGA